ncbi:beta-lactamase family protein [Halosquirtibacter xylanolyticus]|uniref:serine hydrolase domain-containing protein n=1 Tax=Halosquirtibacter xylanolyticus TaxID=3374599 RepID=UPI00374A7047|nr:beta-lactamase family protein [Prolixibacteraceae bacterium]
MKKKRSRNKVLICTFLSVFLLYPYLFFTGSEGSVHDRAGALYSTASYISSPIEVTENAQGRIDRMVSRFMEREEMHGLSLAFAKDGKVVYSRAFGVVDTISNDSVNTSTLFRIASVSKLVTAVGVGRLCDEKKISLDQKVFGDKGIINDTTYMPYKDKLLDKVTVRNLLEHSGGWTQRYGDPMFNTMSVAKKVGASSPCDADAMLKYITSRRLHFTPGSRCCYSNLGYFILGQVIEKVSGMSYEEYINKYILYPSGILDMKIGNSFADLRFENETNYYEPEGSFEVMAYDGSNKLVYKSNGGNNIPLLSSAGGWVSSPTDLLLLSLSIDGDDNYPDIISNSFIKKMASPRRGFDPLGWRGIDYSGNLFRTGSMPGTQALLKQQKNGISYAIVTNTNSWKGPRFSQSLGSLMTSLERKLNLSDGPTTPHVEKTKKRKVKKKSKPQTFYF